MGWAHRFIILSTGISSSLLETFMSFDLSRPKTWVRSSAWHTMAGRIMYYKWLKCVHWRLKVNWKTIQKIFYTIQPSRARRLTFGQNDVLLFSLLAFLYQKLKLITIHFQPTIHFSHLYMIQRYVVVKFCIYGIWKWNSMYL